MFCIHKLMPVFLLPLPPQILPHIALVFLASFVMRKQPCFYCGEPKGGSHKAV